MKYIHVGSGQQSALPDIKTYRDPAVRSYIKMTYDDIQVDVYMYLVQQCMMSFTMNLS
jgi:hypothetical protein